MKLATIVAVLTTCLLLSVAGTALAATPTQDAYSGVAGQQATGGGGSNPSGTADTSSSTLPFTGTDLLLIAIVGTALVGTGVAIRRASRPPA
jgi:hypothetical protein